MSDTPLDDDAIAAMEAEMAAKGQDKVEPADDPAEGEPKKRRRRADAGQPRGPRGPRKGVTKLADKLTEFANLVAAGVSTLDATDGFIVAHNAERLGKAWAPVVARNPKLVQFIAQLEQGGALGGAIIATAAVALPIILHHRPEVLPPPLRAAALMLAPDEVKGGSTHTPHASA